MSIIFGGEMVEAVLFSSLSGQLTFGGKPASGAKVSLWIKWKDQKGETHTYTADNKGYFQTPKITSNYKPTPLAQLVITQEITINYQNIDYLVWTLSKSSYQEYGELGGIPVDVACELTDDMETIRTDDLLMGTNCRWSKIDK